MKIRSLLPLVVLFLEACAFLPGGSEVPEHVGAGQVDDARLLAAADENDVWLSYGRTQSEQRFSPLTQIDENNVGELGLHWAFEPGTRRGLEATPLLVDGVFYTTGTWSVVFAIDARTGDLKWRYDPRVPRKTAGIACCDVVNRGVAVYRGRVYVGTLDGRLVSLDAETGEPIFEVVTTDPTRPYTITMAPRVVKGKVILGNGGAEFGVRGYVSAYDWETGELVWRFYTVPGDPSQPFEHAELEAAAKTWTGEWWKVGGGGTVWDSIAYDPELDLLYVGTGNGSPWSRYVRSPGGGDNLYVSSILALRPDTGKLVWYYQNTPGDNWDFTSTQHIMLAELEIDGRERRVLMQAPKNGFFYVLDRETGELISAEAYAKVTWAKGIDKKTGRPIEVEGLDYRNTVVEVYPSPHGAHNWHPMSFNPQTGLVYIPANEIPYFFKLDPEYEYKPGAWNLGYDFTVADSFPREVVSGHLLAWDPVAQKEVWRAQYTSPWNGGTLSTAGNLVFQGTAHGTFVAYRASDGKQLWETPAGTGIVAAPMTYELDGAQYVAVMAGWGGAFALAAGDAAAAAGTTDNTGRLLVYKLGGTARLPVHEAIERELAAIPADLDADQVLRGNHLFHRWCGTCHGSGAVSGGVLPDLRQAAPGIYDTIEDIVLRGVRMPNGMPSFAEWLEPSDVADLRAYLLSRRAALLEERAAAVTP
ncbi:MAG: PQQ-dependent dehydrogenase, methanol/ethanol family [Deltaproteobacteria bacterium]|nr:PQQ-dependent dehydrogenase, methanol/ethanol family [Deltaproteobacteria bacterium]MBW2393810.1 PQQ-dependent dehydrogenase, methanol/ethanol family [Deltaproteobacteria bacterium]